MTSSITETEISNDKLLSLLQSRAKEDPALMVLAENIFKELRFSLEANLAKKWANIIKETGAAKVNGKLHPDWFADKDPNTLLPLDKEPGFSDGGEVSCPHKPGLSYSPLSDAGINILRYGELEITPIRMTTGTQVLLISPERQADDQYNNETLGARFHEPWREVMWIGWTKPNPLVKMDRTKRLELKCMLFLPAQRVEEFYNAITQMPILAESIIHELWPNLPIDLVARDRMFIKKLDDSDLEKKYMEPFLGGHFLSYD